MSSVSNSIEGESIGESKILKILLTEKLQELRSDDVPPTEETLGAILDILAANEKLPTTFIDMNGIKVIIDASKHAFATLKMQRSVSRIFVLFARDEPTHFLENGGLDRILEIVNSEQSDNEILSKLSRAIGIFVDNASLPQVDLMKIFESFFPLMERRIMDGIAFQCFCNVLGHLIGPGGIDLPTEWSERLIKCVLEGFTVHKHNKDVQRTGRYILVKSVGRDAADEILIDIPIDGPFLPDKMAHAIWNVVMRIGCKDYVSWQDTVKGIDMLLLLAEHSSINHEAFHGLLVSMNAFEAILDATKRDTSANRYFLERAGRFLSTVLYKGDHDLSAHFLNIGGFERSLEIMQTSANHSFLAIVYNMVVGRALSKLSEEERASFAVRAFEAALAVIAMHENDAYVFTTACEVLYVCLDGPRLQDHYSLLSSAMRVLFDSLVKHWDVEVAQNAGQSLLSSLLGPDTAWEVISHAESRHREERRRQYDGPSHEHDANCARAA